MPHNSHNLTCTSLFVTSPKEYIHPEFFSGFFEEVVAYRNSSLGKLMLLYLVSSSGFDLGSSSGFEKHFEL